MAQTKLAVLAFAALLVAAGPADAQRGVGDPEGVGRWDTPPPTETIAGQVTDVRIAECEHTTGHADLGAHVFLATADGRTLNVHLGPIEALEDFVAGLDDGDSVSAEAFHTEAMPADHFVAVTVTVDGETFRLRAADDLQPVWATGPRAGARIAADDLRPRQGAAPRLRGQAPEVVERCWWHAPRRGQR